MNKFIKEQLDKCRIQLPEYDDNTTHLLINRNQDIVAIENLQVGGNYLFELADYVINEPPSFTLSSNWNKGTKPPEKVVMCSVQEIMGKMIKVLAIGQSTNTQWIGYLPRKAIKVLKKYE